MDVQEFEFNLEDNLFQLHSELKQKIWKPNSYHAFYVRDPKLRHIHKATIKDRVFNHALFRILYPIFDKTFIFDSYSCRVNKGTHRGVLRLQSYVRQISRNYTKPAFALKCDVKKYFDNINHLTLMSLVERKIKDRDILELIGKIINSFEAKVGAGLPLGNVTSQVFANVYLNELDQYIKHTLKVKHYLRYCDDFIILNETETKLNEYIGHINNFLVEKLKLQLHPNKIVVRKVHQGVDFLGYVVMPGHILLRAKTRKRMLKKVHFAKESVQEGTISELTFSSKLTSYKGMLTHCKGNKIHKKILNIIK